MTRAGDPARSRPGAAPQGCPLCLWEEGRLASDKGPYVAYDLEFLGGETVKAKVIASEPATDLSLIQIERVPPGAKVAVMANSDNVQVGDPVYIVGAFPICPRRVVHYIGRHSEASAGGWAPICRGAAHGTRIGCKGL